MLGGNDGIAFPFSVANYPFSLSDLYYDPSICRNIMVDARYIMFIIDKYANAQNLIQEIETVE